MPTETAFTRLVHIMARLRGPDGCPWDREQSHATLRPYVIEEAYEVLDAIDNEDPAELRDELGDLLLQVVFHAQLAAERGDFEIADVCTAICDKLERRHPHVFADITVRDSTEVVRNWAHIKAEERSARGKSRSAVGGLPASLPALLTAERLGEKARRVGFDWPSIDQVLLKVREELQELEQAIAADEATHAGAELGDLLLTLASVGRHIGSSAELALRAATARFVDRFRAMERQASADGVPLEGRSAGDLDRLWRAAKQELADQQTGH
jgi:MazG family protein